MRYLYGAFSGKSENEHSVNYVLVRKKRIAQEPPKMFSYGNIKSVIFVTIGIFGPKKCPSGFLADFYQRVNL
jgi:hypothetical protein